MHFSNHSSSLFPLFLSLAPFEVENSRSQPTAGCMCAGSRFFPWGCRWKTRTLSAPARDTICPHSFLCRAHHPITPKPSPTILTLSLPLLMPAQQGTLPWNAVPLFTPLLIWFGFFFLTLIYHHHNVLHKVFATQSYSSEYHCQKVMLCLRQFLLSSSLVYSTIKHNLSPNVSKTSL